MQRKLPLALLASGLVLGVGGVALTAFGNPANMGLCVACFLRDIAGALALDSAAAVQYLRPEIAGLVLGAFLLARARGEAGAAGGSAPVLRLVISFFVMLGALVFLGCPLRLALRLAGGDLNALIGFAGFAAGVFAGGQFLKQGFSLGRPEGSPPVAGFVAPVAAVILLAFLFVRPDFINFSESGPGSMRAPVLAALALGLLAGGLAQRGRMCMAGGIRDLFLIRNWTLFSGYAVLFAGALAANLLLGNFNPGFANQPIAHTDSLWNFLGMALVGLGSVMAGGCPLRQLIMAGEGNGGAAVCAVGMILGAATAHNFNLASSAAGVTAGGRIAVIVGIVVLSVIAVACSRGGRAGGSACGGKENAKPGVPPCKS